MTEPLLLWGIALLAVALLLVVLEVFLPSAGLISIVATGCGIGGVVCLWRVSPTWGITGLVSMLVLGPTVFLFMLNVLPSTKLGRDMMGMPSDEDRAKRALDERRQRDERAALVGMEGTALTDLRPIGVIDIEGQRFDALAASVAISKGTRVRVVEATLAEIKVRPA